MSKTPRKRIGQTVSREAKVWYDMIARCYHPQNRRYKDYGAKGIGVCEQWRGKLGRDRFVAYMGPRPDGHELGRKDNTKGYEPGNVAWVTGSQQRRNQCTAAKAQTEQGTVSLVDLAEQHGLDGRLVRRRVQWAGWTVAQALELEPRPTTRKLDEAKVSQIKLMLARGDESDGYIAEMFGVSRALISQIRHGKKWATVAAAAPEVCDE
jgi:hypothetical protein